MIIRLKGGLGNQLFQWALGRALEHRGYVVQYEASILGGSRDRKYLLGDLGLNLPIVTFPDRYSQRNEGPLRFQANVLDYPDMRNDDFVFDGYWQSEKYFADIGDQIRKEVFDEIGRLYFLVLSSATVTSEHIIKQTSESCFIHIRRSDNLRPTSTIYHGLTDANAPYYQRAIKIMRERFPGVKFYVFSDDSEYIKATFTAADMVCVTHNAPSFTVDDTNNLHKTENGREVEDLYLMSLCRHAIIANSTFSWWGAWLNRDEAKEPRERLVIAPDPWFSGETNLDATDIIPDRWLKVSTL